jgi:phospholipid N-methyltransferase
MFSPWPFDRAVPSNLLLTKDLEVLKELRAFLREFRSNFRTTGAVLPSSRFLAEEITSRLKLRPASSVRVLEVGPATGAFTRKILTYLGPEDHLDLCEINPRFVTHLKTWLSKQANGPRIRIFPRSILEIEPGPEYDYIISGLPLNNFKPEEVDAILRRFLQLGRPGTEFSDFEYWSLRPLKTGLSKGPERDRLKEVDAVVRRFITEHGSEKSIVWRNFPPARALHFRFRDNGSSANGKVRFKMQKKRTRKG